MVAGDASARTTTNTGNTIATKYLHLVMRVLAGGSTSALSKFARECEVASGQYRMLKHCLTHALHKTKHKVYGQVLYFKRRRNRSGWSGFGCTTF